MKKIFSLAISLIMLFSVTSAYGSSSKKSDGLSLPLTTKNEKLTLLVLEDGQGRSWEENDQTDWMREKTGIDIQFELLPAQEGAQRMRLLLTSGDYPDIIMVPAGLSNSDLYDLGRQGIILPLNEYIDTIGHYLPKVFEEIPAAKDLVTYPDGNIYTFPYWNECYHCYVEQRMYIYTPWLEELDLDMPTTTDEFYEVMKAFKDNDLNGTGKSQIPLAGHNVPNGLPYSFLMQPFIYYSTIESEYYVTDNGEVIIPFDKPEWKEGLEYIRKLYAEGLIAPETFTQNQEQLRSMVISDPPILGAFLNRFYHSLTGSGPTAVLNREEEFSVVEPLKGPSGLQQTPWRPRSASNSTYFSITNNCKNPELAYKLGDFMMSEECSWVSLWGVDGIGREAAPKGSLGINGKPAVTRRLAPVEGRHYNWFSYVPMIATADMRLGLEFNSDDPTDPNRLESKLYELTLGYEKYAVPAKNVLPLLYFEEDELILNTDLADIRTYATDSAARFITGDLNLDKDWDSYLNTLKRMGYEKYEELYQSLYDRAAN